MKDLVESVSDNTFRLKYPRALTAESLSGAQWDSPDSLDRQALDHYRGRLTREGAHYMDVLCHSLCLHRVEDPEILYRHVQDTCMPKLHMGGGDICELEISRALSFLGEEQSSVEGRIAPAAG